MNRADLEEKIADYAFGSISEAEREAFAAELPNYPDLATEYCTIWQPTIESLPFAVEPVDLPAGMRQRVLGAALADAGATARATQSARLNGVVTTQVAIPQPAKGTVGIQAAPVPTMVERKIVALPNSWWRKLVVLFSRPVVALSGMAVLLLISLVSVGWGIGLNNQLNQTQAQLTAEQQEITTLLADHDTRMVALQPTANWQRGYGSAVYDPDKNLIYVTMSGPPPSDNSNCQVWALKNGQPTSLGVFKMTAWDFSYMIHSPTDLRGYSGLMISWEKPGGASAPTNNTIMVEGQIENN